MMRQAQIVEGMVSKLRHTLAKLKDADTTMSLNEVLLVDIGETLREFHRYVRMVEQKCEQAEIQSNRRRFY